VENKLLKGVVFNLLLLAIPRKQAMTPALKIHHFLGLFGLILLLSCGKKPPKANFEFSVKNAGMVEFYNTTVGIVDSYTWVFDDGDSSELVNPIHRYNAPGTYNVTLYATNENGEEMVSKAVEIEIGEREDFSGHPAFADADVYLIAQNRITYFADSPLVVQNIRGAAIAGLYDTTNFFVDAGVVSANGERLEQQDDNTYFYLSDDSSYYFTDQVNWRVDGGAQYPTIIESHVSRWPSISGIIYNPIVNTASNYVLGMQSPPVDADGVLYQITDTSGTVLVSRAELPSFSSFTFQTSDLDSLTSGVAKVRILAYNFDSMRVDGRKLYFVNESSTETQVEIN
jgi:PKD repeat protein